MKKIFSLIVFSIFLASIVTSLPQDANQEESFDFDYPEEVNYSKVNVNNSFFWQGYTPSTIVSFFDDFFLLLSSANDPVYNQLELNGSASPQLLVNNSNSPGIGFHVPTGTSVPSSNQSAGTGINNTSAGTFNWTNPENIASSNNQYANVTIIGGGQFSVWLVSQEHGFNIPLGSSITQINACIEGMYTSTEPTKDFAVQLWKGGSAFGDNEAYGTDFSEDVDGLKCYQWDANELGAGITPAEVNADDFGLGLISNTLLGSANTKIDSMNIQVWYTTGGTNEIYQQNNTGNLIFSRNGDEFINFQNNGVGNFSNTIYVNNDDEVCTSENGRCNQTPGNSSWNQTFATSLFSSQLLSVANQTNTINTNVSTIGFSGTFILSNLSNGRVNISLNADTCTGNQVSFFNGNKFTCVVPTGGGGGGSINIQENGNEYQVNVSTISFNSNIILQNESGKVNVSINQSYINANLNLSQPRFFVWRNSSQTITTGGFGTEINFTREDEDPYSMHSGDDARIYFTNTTAGFWIFSSSISWASNTAGIRDLTIIRISSGLGNGNFCRITSPPASGDETRMTASCPFRVQEGDYVAVSVRHTRGSNLDINTADYNPSFEGARVSA